MFALQRTVTPFRGRPARIPSIPEPLADLVVGSSTGYGHNWLLAVTTSGRLYALGNPFRLSGAISLPRTFRLLAAPPSPPVLVFPTYPPTMVTEDGRVYTFTQDDGTGVYQQITEWPPFYAAGGNDIGLWFITEDGLLHMDKRREVDASASDYQDGVRERVTFRAPRPLVHALVTNSYVVGVTVDGDVYKRRIRQARWDDRRGVYDVLQRELLGDEPIVPLTEQITLPPVRALGGAPRARITFALTEDERCLYVPAASGPLYSVTPTNVNRAPVLQAAMIDSDGVIARLLESGELVLGDLAYWATWLNGVPPGPIRTFRHAENYTVVVLEDGRFFHAGALYSTFVRPASMAILPGPGFRQLL